MNLNPPKKITFWAAIILAVISLVIYILHVFWLYDIQYFAGVGYLLLLAAFVLLVLGLLLKNL